LRWKNVKAVAHDGNHFITKEIKLISADSLLKGDVDAGAAGAVVLLLLVLVLVLVLTESRVASCCWRPIWRIKKKTEIDACVCMYVSMKYSQIQSDTVRYALCICVCIQGKIQADTYTYALPESMHMCMYPVNICMYVLDIFTTYILICTGYSL
jgi:hypothetical protein